MQCRILNDCCLEHGNPRSINHQAGKVLLGALLVYVESQVLACYDALQLRQPQA